MPSLKIDDVRPLMGAWQDEPLTEEPVELQPEIQRWSVLSWALSVFRSGPSEMRPMARYAALRVADEWIQMGRTALPEHPEDALMKWSEAMGIYALSGDLALGQPVYEEALKLWADQPEFSGVRLSDALGGFEAYEQYLAAEQAEQLV